MCCSGKCALSDSTDVVQLCVRILDDQCKDEEWSKEKSLNHLKNKLIKAYLNSEVTEETYNQECNEIVSHGIFSESVISKLLRYGMSKEDIINVMKYGTESEKFKHLSYFHTFNMAEENMNEELIEKLKNANFSDEESSEIILNGLVYQNECYLFRLTSNDIFAAKIVNWQGRVTEASNSVIEFLEKLGLDEDTLKIVAKKGISAEAKAIIKDLGYIECNQCIYSEKVEAICHCMDNKKSNPNSTQSSNESCNCSEECSIATRESYERRNFIRTNLMAPLTWAMSETLKYNPTDPVHYIACQLLRWKHNNVDPLEMKKVVDLVNKEAVSN